MNERLALPTVVPVCQAGEGEPTGTNLVADLAWEM